MDKSNLNAAPVSGRVKGVDAVSKPQVFNVRGRRVVLDRELASAFGVETKLVKRNVKRHPELFISEDFAFEMTEEECLRCLADTTNHSRRGGSRYLPIAITEKGVQVLKSLMKSYVDVDFNDEPSIPTIYEESWNEGTVVLYQPNETLNLEVRVDEETVWLTQEQIIALFNSSKSNISEHLRNIFESGELLERATVRKNRTVQIEGDRSICRDINYYNLDVIISVGFRVNTKRGIKFRQWANQVIKQKIVGHYNADFEIKALRCEMNNRFADHEYRISMAQKQIDFFVKTSLPPKEQIFMQGQFFDAHQLFSELISGAKHRVIIIDNYVDSSVLALLSKRSKGVKGIIYTSSKCCNHDAFKLDLQKYNTQYPNAVIDVLPISGIHDRFLITDNVLYSSGGSFKDAGKKLFYFEKMGLEPEVILNIVMNG